MGEELTPVLGMTARFIPSHLTKALVASTVALVCGVYAAWEFAQVEQEEVIAMITGR